LIDYITRIPAETAFRAAALARFFGRSRALAPALLPTWLRVVLVEDSLPVPLLAPDLFL